MMAHWVISCLLAVLCLTGMAAPAAGQGFLWDGRHWSRCSEDAKLAYLWGVSNLADLEASSAAKAGTGAAVSEAVRQEMQRSTAAELARLVDQFYRQHPDRLETTVLEVLLGRGAPQRREQPPKGKPAAEK